MTDISSTESAPAIPGETLDAMATTVATEGLPSTPQADSKIGVGGVRSGLFRTISTAMFHAVGLDKLMSSPNSDTGISQSPLPVEQPTTPIVSSEATTSSPSIPAPTETPTAAPPANAPVK